MPKKEKLNHQSKLQVDVQYYDDILFVLENYPSKPDGYSWPIIRRLRKETKQRKTEIESTMKENDPND